MNEEIIYLGNPLLRQISEPILEEDFGSLKLKELEKKLFLMMEAEQGLGLAAPQMGISKRAVVFGLEHPTLDSIPLTVLFNPSFTALSDETTEDYEGCISVGPLCAKVNRYKKIFYCGYDAEGQLIEREASDLHARVVQHEIDHLNGVIFLDRVSNYHSLGFKDELIKAALYTPRKS